MWITSTYTCREASIGYSGRKCLSLKSHNLLYLSGSSSRFRPWWFPLLLLCHQKRIAGPQYSCGYDFHSVHIVQFGRRSLGAHDVRRCCRNHSALLIIRHAWKWPKQEILKSWNLKTQKLHLLGETMHKFDYFSLAMPAFQHLFSIDQYCKKSSVDPIIMRLVQIYASQINGCAFCVDIHCKEAKIAGERELRIYHVTVGEESPLFTEKEKGRIRMDSSCYFDQSRSRFW